MGRVICTLILFSWFFLFFGRPIGNFGWREGCEAARKWYAEKSAYLKDNTSPRCYEGEAAGWIE